MILPLQKTSPPFSDETPITHGLASCLFHHSSAKDGNPIGFDMPPYRAQTFDECVVMADTNQRTLIGCQRLFQCHPGG